ncbi:MAG: cupin domain-containing protein [Chloroflexota bacterium]
MTLNDYFPDLIRQLPAFEGPFDAFRLEAEDCEVLLAAYPAGTEISEHSHDTENVGVITRGELLLTMGGVTQAIAAGQWYHIAAGEPHQAEFPVDTATIEFWFRR